MKQRATQVSEELRKIISMIFIDDVSDPRMGFITITRVEMTDDLRFARVFYSILGDEAKKAESLEALEENMPFIRRLAVERLNKKFAPEIRFVEDHGIDETFKIDAILKKIKKNEDK